jgi:REP element-mobilizing transposase RayT
MSDEKFQNKYRIKTVRAMWHNYNSGAYFITVCTKNREHFLGRITNISAIATVETRHATSLQTPTMQLYPIGQFLTEKIQNITSHCPYAEIPLFVVMPNHWHAVVFIDGDKIPYNRRDINCDDVTCRDGACPVSTMANETKNEHMQRIDSCKGWLSVAIGGIKSAVTKFAHDNDIDFAWQTRFDDRIIRNREEMNRIADYIENNPARWNIDCFNENNKKRTRHATSLQYNDI